MSVIQCVADYFLSTTMDSDYFIYTVVNLKKVLTLLFLIYLNLPLGPLSNVNILELYGPYINWAEKDPTYFLSQFFAISLYSSKLCFLDPMNFLFISKLDLK